MLSFEATRAADEVVDGVGSGMCELPVVGKLSGSRAN